MLVQYDAFVPSEAEKWGYMCSTRQHQELKLATEFALRVWIF